MKIVARSGAGVDHVNLAAATRFGILVTNTPGATSPAVADFTIALILNLLRNIPTMAQAMKSGRWEQFCGRELGALTLGIVGTGSIGREVVKRANAFRATILGFDIQPDAQFAQEHQVRYVSLDELMSQSDVVSLHCPLSDQTRGLIDGRLLGLMKPQAHLGLLICPLNRKPILGMNLILTQVTKSMLW